jgi:hypothetical protein
MYSTYKEVSYCSVACELNSPFPVSVLAFFSLLSQSQLTHRFIETSSSTCTAHEFSSFAFSCTHGNTYFYEVTNSAGAHCNLISVCGCQEMAGRY